MPDSPKSTSSSLSHRSRKQDIQEPETVASTSKAPRPAPIDTASVTKAKIRPHVPTVTSNWGAYVIQRFAFVPLLLIAFGIMLSAFYFYEIDSEYFRLRLGEFFWGGFTIFLSFVLLRFIDDYQNWPAALVARPFQTLPVDIIDPAQLKKVIIGLTALLMINALILGICVDWSAGLMAAGILVYQLILWKEFASGKLLAKSPLTSILAHQPLFFIYGLFSLCMYYDSDAFRALESYYFCIYFLGVLFIFDVSSKLDPNAHPLVGGYRQYYGRGIAFILFLAAISITVVGGILTRLNVLSWPAEIILVIVGALYLFVLSKDTDPREFEADKLPPPDPKAKIVQGVALLVVLWHVLIIPIAGWTDIYSPLWLWY